MKSQLCHYPAMVEFGQVTQISEMKTNVNFFENQIITESKIKHTQKSGTQRLLLLSWMEPDLQACRLLLSKKKQYQVAIPHSPQQPSQTLVRQVWCLAAPAQCDTLLNGSWDHRFPWGLVETVQCTPFPKFALLACLLPFIYLPRQHHSLLVHKSLLSLSHCIVSWWVTWCGLQFILAWNMFTLHSTQYI